MSILPPDNPLSRLFRACRPWLRKAWVQLWVKSAWRKAGFIFLSLIILFTGSMYGVAEWYVHKHAGEPLALGTTFVPDYANSFGLEPDEALQTILAPASAGGLGMKQIRLVSYWKDIEQTPGTYNFDELDREFTIADRAGAHVSLSIGLRQPRWPECHEPDWTHTEPTQQWESQLYTFIQRVVNRYKHDSALESWQLENEFFMKVFGTCTNFDRSRLVHEFNMVKKLDPAHPIIVSRSDNWIGIPVGQPKADQYAISVYKRVWDATFTHRYFEYPLPPWFYAALAGSEELVSGKSMIIHELQAEPWAPSGKTIQEISLNEQFKSMNAARMKSRIKYGEDTGMRSIDLWGAEWWYWLKTVKHDPSVWNVVQKAVADADTQNQKLTKK